jgi:hypothetical protein
MAHQPMYCSPNDDNDDCHSLLSLMRDGVLGEFGFEKLINAYGVEVHLGAHEHAYERNYPVFQMQWSGETGPAAYVDFNKTVHILTGAAGCPENTDVWQNSANAFSAFRVAVMGQGGAISTRNFIPHRVHEAIGVFGAVSVATACVTPGSVAAEVAGIEDVAAVKELEVEHPTGFFTVAMDVELDGDTVKVNRSALLRTARKLMSGQVFIPGSVWGGP